MAFEPINPISIAVEFIKERAFRNFLRLLHTTERIILGPLAPQVKTTGNVVMRWEEGHLIRYFHPEKERKYGTPIVIIPPLMVTPDIFDLRPGHSLVSFLLDYGFDVYILDFGVPTMEDQRITIDNYVLEFIPNAIDRIGKVSKNNTVSLIGWSMGGIFSLMYSAIGERGTRVKNIVIIGSPVDFTKSRLIHLAARMGNKVVLKTTDIMGNIPPVLSKTGFKLLSPIGMIMRYKELFVNLWDREWLMGYETIGHWVDGFIPYPGMAFKQFFSDFVVGDGFKNNDLVIGGERVNLKKIKSSLLVFTGTTDKIAPPPTVTAVIDFVSSEDHELIQVPLGHIGLVAGGSAPGYVWRPMARWLAKRS